MIIMIKVFFVCVVHKSSIRSNGFEMAKRYLETLERYIEYPFEIYFIDNQSEERLIDQEFISNEKVKVVRIENQYLKGLTGAWN